MSVTSGWGRLTWNQANWNAEATTLKTGWGAQSWSGEGGWGDLSDQTITVTGLSITSSVGSVDVLQIKLLNTNRSINNTSSQGEAFVPVNIEGVSFNLVLLVLLTPNDQTQGL